MKNDKKIMFLLASEMQGENVIVDIKTIFLQTRKKKNHTTKNQIYKLTSEIKVTSAVNCYKAHSEFHV